MGIVVLWGLVQDPIVVIITWFWHFAFIMCCLSVPETLLQCMKSLNGQSVPVVSRAMRSCPLWGRKPISGNSSALKILFLGSVVNFTLLFSI